MQEGFYFYWLLWMLWIFFFFFYPKTVIRMKWIVGILIIVALSGLEISLDSLTINCSMFGLILLAGLLMSEQSHSYFLTLCSFSFSIGYTGLLFFEQISPVWMVFPRLWLFSFLFTLVLLFISSKFIEQTSILTLGLVMGDLLHSFIIYSYGMEKLIVGLDFLDTWATALSMVFVWNVGRKLVFKIDQIVEAHTQTKTRWIR